MKVKIETTGQFRSGVSQKGKPYVMAEAFAHLPNCPYPQKFSYYCAAQGEVLPAGNYEADVILSVRDDRLNFEVDPRQARRLPQAAPAQAAKAS